MFSSLHRVVLVTWETCLAYGLDYDFVGAWLGGATAAGSHDDASTPDPLSSLPHFMAAISSSSIAKSRAPGPFQKFRYLIPDPLAVAVALRPRDVATALLGPFSVRVELHGTLTRGMTVVDWDGLMPHDGAGRAGQDNPRGGA